MVGKYVPYLYNNLSPSGGFELEFEEDLFELFGTEDLSEKGLVGKWDSQLEDFESVRWNWGTSSLKGFTGLFYLLNCLEKDNEFSYSEFEEFYNNEIKNQNNILQKLREKNLIGSPFLMIYTLRYRNYYFPALLLRIKKIEWNKEEHLKYPIFIDFVPEKYFVVSSDVWKDLDSQCRSRDYWTDYLEKKYGIKLTEGMKKVIKSYTFTQNLYRVMPISLLEEKFTPETEEDSDGLLYLKDVEKRVEHPEREFSFTDNQIFWGLFHSITNTKQQVYTPELKIDGEKFQIKNIPINTLSERTNVFRQEAGVANTLCYNLFDAFRDDYLNHEFDGRRTITAGETSILRRAVRLGEVADSPREEFENTNFDYAVFLDPLGVEKSLLFSLTTALWEKGRGKTYTDYVEQSREMLFRTPQTTDGIITIWFMTITETQNSWFGNHKTPDSSIQDMVDRITTDLSSSIEYEFAGEEDFSSGDSKIVILSMFEETPQSKNVERELEGLLSTPRETKFYSVVGSLIKNS